MRLWVVAVVIAAIVLTGTALAQHKSDDGPLKPVTVCEILANPQVFNGKNLAVLGRFSFTDEGQWLVDDGCGTKLVTDGYTWRNLIWLDRCHEAAPDPPSGSLILDESDLNEKLVQVRRTTQLKVQRRWVNSGIVHKDGTTESTSGWRDVKDEWAVVYGRLEARNNLKPPQGNGPNRYWGNGFGHLAAAPVQLVIKQNNIRTIPDPMPPSPGR